MTCEVRTTRHGGATSLDFMPGAAVARRLARMNARKCAWYRSHENVRSNTSVPLVRRHTRCPTRRQTVLPCTVVRGTMGRGTVECGVCCRRPEGRPTRTPDALEAAVGAT